MEKECSCCNKSLEEFHNLKTAKWGNIHNVKHVEA